MVGTLLSLWLSCSRPPAPPDVVLVVVDTLRADTLGFSGYERPTSPHLDALAEQSTWFSRAYAPSTWTLPSVTSILTGLYPFEHRVVHDWQDPDQFGRLVSGIPTLPETLAKQGYRTAAFVNNSFLAPAFGLNRGWDVYDYQGASLTEHRTATATLDAAIEWLEASTEPALLMVHVMEPHADYTAPKPFQGRFSKDLPHSISLPLGDVLIDELIQGEKTLPKEDQVYLKAVYDEEVLTTDAALGQFLGHLKKRKGWENTRLLVTSDHGEEFWEYESYEHGHSTRSVVTQVPLILKTPGATPGKNDSVVDLTLVMDALLDTPGSDLNRIARAGAYETGRYALSEDILYGPQEISIVSDTLRLIIQQETETATLLELDTRGWESQDLSMDPAQRARGQGLYEAIVGKRGDLARTSALNSVAVPGAEVFEQLRTLGYVE